jgi:signal transduction histidine kinase
MIKRGDGSTFAARLESIQSDWHHNGNPTIRVAISDITYIRQAEAALRMSNKKLALLTSITRHDIINQLTILSGSLELSQGNVKETERNVHISRAMKAADTIRRQIAFSREYEDLGSKIPAWQGLSGIVRSAASQLATTAITVEVPNDNLRIYGDPLLMKVFYNLFDNARQHGGGVTRISVSHQPTNSGLMITVADNGSGVSAEDKLHLFERGYGKNTGLGLFLSQEILSITGITISEKGIAGKGAQFEIVVPKGAFRFEDSQAPPK